jgi:hypothetical protein
MLPYRQGSQGDLPKVELISGEGAVGVRLTTPDGSRDIVAFRTDARAETVSCSGIESTGQVFAQGWNKDGQTIRQFAHAGGD